ncbi:hypothetical protein [Helicobacter cetorum]|uniref:hypothetical protein n=1 Tax=Helicobacter cetorum TaxID=138563 RepID=UPI000CF121E0|nr:hypothetical protein [Helicobacter cetorum]
MRNRNIVENFNIDKGDKVEIKIDNKEMLEEYTKYKLKDSHSKGLKIVFVCSLLIISTCLTCAYIFKGF